MNYTPDFDTFCTLAKDANVVPVYSDVLADVETPVSAYAKLSRHRPAFLFESITGGEQISRYSFVGCKPRKTYSVYADKTIITHGNGDTETVPTMDDPMEIIEQEIAPCNAAVLPDMPRFTGGAVGFVGYEYVHYSEPTVPLAEKDELGMPILYFMLADTVLIFDHARQIMRVCSNAHIGDDPRAAYDKAIQSIQELLEDLRTPLELPLADIPLETPNNRSYDQNFTESAFESVVDVTKEYVRAGDVIQVVGSQRFSDDYSHTPLDLYRALRVVNPSPYMFIIDSGDFATVGASPEVHVRLTGDLVEMRPIAGTRPRGKTVEEDLAYEEDLLADEKERAEHLMLVDLARNDLGRVCKMGQVEVPEYMIIERYSHVMHIVSQVQGNIADDKNAFDVMRATFPAGTVSGAPKVRAMQIIAELEGTQRGPYAGALGHFGYDGNHDSCIMIRTALIKDGKIYIQSGAGIVADSVPKNEYEETLNKSRAMRRAIALADALKQF